MNNAVTGKQCDLCYDKTHILVVPASLLDHIEDLDWMCKSCNDRLSATLTEGRKFVHKYLADILLEEATLIRDEHRPSA